MLHEINIKKYKGTLTELAEDIGNLRYDALAEFLDLLSVKIKGDGEQDKAKGRVQLAKQLQECANYLEHSKENIIEAWRISEPFMKREDKND